MAANILPQLKHFSISYASSSSSATPHSIKIKLSGDCVVSRSAREPELGGGLEYKDYCRWSRYFYGWLYRASLSGSVEIICIVKLCCSPFSRSLSRSQARQLFEDPVLDTGSECTKYANNYKKKSRTIHGANLLCARILAPYL